MRLFATLVGLLAVLAACKPTGSQQSADPKSVTISGAPPIEVDSSGVIGLGFRFASTLGPDKSPYEVKQSDCGFVLRTNSTTPFSMALPQLKFPCTLMIFNDNVGLLSVTPATDINGDKVVNLPNQGGLLISAHQSEPSAFWRGLITQGATASQPPPVPASSYADLTDFKLTEDSNKKFTIQPGNFAVGSYSFASQIGGSLELTASPSGIATVYVSKLGILTCEAVVGTTAKATGQMVLIAAAQPSFQPGSVPIAELSLNNGTYTVAKTGLASRVRSFALEPGPGIDISYTQGVALVSVDATVGRTDVAGAATASYAMPISIGALIIALFAVWIAYKVWRRVT